MGGGEPPSFSRGNGFPFLDLLSFTRIFAAAAIRVVGTDRCASSDNRRAVDGSGTARAVVAGGGIGSDAGIAGI